MTMFKLFKKKPATPPRRELTLLEELNLSEDEVFKLIIEETERLAKEAEERDKAPPPFGAILGRISF